MIKAVLFDMDGLILDTEHLSDQAFIYVGKKMELPITEEFLTNLKGRTRSDCTAIMKRQWGQDVDLAVVREMHRDFIHTYIEENGVPIKSGLKELMVYLKSHNFKIGLATSTYKGRAEKLLEECGILQYFDQMVFGDMVERGKPEPDIYLKCAAKVHCKPDECLVLEDSPNGILAGYSAGCHVIMIPDSIQPSDNEMGRTERIVSNLRDVIPYLEEDR
jgi:haloacid dehalogenase superfamily, subfamily IA, variant 3 with third motif having DD or ED